MAGGGTSKYRNLCRNPALGQLFQQVGSSWRSAVTGECGSHALCVLAEGRRAQHLLYGLPQPFWRALGGRQMMPAPVSTTRRAISGLSHSVGTTISGTPALRWICTVAEPPVVIITAKTRKEFGVGYPTHHAHIRSDWT